MSVYKCTFMLLWVFMWAHNAVSIESAPSKNDEAYKLELNVNVIGAEAAAQNLSMAMLKVSESVNQALQSDKLTTRERQALLETLHSFNAIKDKFKLNLADARTPINDLMVDTRLELNKAALELNETVIDPVVNKFELMFYVLLGVVVLLVLAILVFIKVYILSSIHRVSNAADNLGRVLDELPQTMKAMTEDSNRSLKFKRRTIGKNG